MSRVEYDPQAILDFVDDHFEPFVLNNHDEMVLICPFCKGGQFEEVSFNVNIESGVARCWRANKCGFAGTVVFMIKEYLQCDWRTAYEVAGGTPPSDIDEVLSVFNRAKGLLRPLDVQFDRFSYHQIDVFPRDAIRLEDSDELDEVCDWLQWTRDYDPDEFMDSHELYVVPNVERFDRRVIFKVGTSTNQAYLAYAYDLDIAKKTLNPPGEVLSKMLYNYDYVRTADTVFVVEGIFDAARLIEWDFSPVAIFGCNLSVQQAFLLADLPADEIIICLDNGAYEKGLAVLKMLSQYVSNKKLSIMDLDVEGADPDSISEEDFLRCFLKRRAVKRVQDDINYLSKV